VLYESVSDPLRHRVLDPACGSGAFLFWAVRRVLADAERAGMSNCDALELVVNQALGIDLHPVVVTLAGVTYLLTIGRECLEHRGELTIPVYLADRNAVRCRTAGEGPRRHSQTRGEWEGRRRRGRETAAVGPSVAVLDPRLPRERGLISCAPLRRDAGDSGAPPARLYEQLRKKLFPVCSPWAMFRRTTNPEMSRFAGCFEG
jgi:hypothetical protein